MSSSSGSKSPFRYAAPALKWGLPGLLFLSLAIVFWPQVWAAVSPFVVAFVLAYILDPVVGWIERGRIPIGRLGAVLTLYLVLLGLILVLLVGVIPRLAGEVQDLVGTAWMRYFPRLEQASREWIEKTAPRARQATRKAWAPSGEESGEPSELPPSPASATEEAAASAEDSAAVSGVPASATPELDLLPLIERLSDPDTRDQLLMLARGGWNVVDAVLTGIKGLVFGFFAKVSAFLASLVNVTIALVILFYLLLDFQALKERLKSLIPPAHAPRTLAILGSIDQQLSAYLRGQVMVCICVGTLVTVGLAGVGLVLDLSVARYALLIGLAAGIFNLVPYLGPVMGATPAVILTIVDLYQPGVPGMWTAMLIQVGVIVVLFVLVQIADGLFISPRIMGNRLDMHPMIIMFALLLGGGIAGFIGMLVAVPAACVVRTLLIEVYLRKAPAPAK